MEDTQPDSILGLHEAPHLSHSANNGSLSGLPPGWIVASSVGDGGGRAGGPDGRLPHPDSSRLYLVVLAVGIVGTVGWLIDGRHYLGAGSPPSASAPPSRWLRQTTVDPTSCSLASSPRRQP